MFNRKYLAYVLLLLATVCNDGLQASPDQYELMPFERLKFNDVDTNGNLVSHEMTIMWGETASSWQELFEGKQRRTPFVVGKGSQQSKWQEAFLGESNRRIPEFLLYNWREKLTGQTRPGKVVGGGNQDADWPVSLFKDGKGVGVEADFDLTSIVGGDWCYVWLGKMGNENIRSSKYKNYFAVYDKTETVLTKVFLFTDINSLRSVWGGDIKEGDKPMNETKLVKIYVTDDRQRLLNADSKKIQLFWNDEGSYIIQYVDGLWGRNLDYEKRIYVENLSDFAGRYQELRGVKEALIARGAEVNIVGVGKRDYLRLKSMSMEFSLDKISPDGEKYLALKYDFDFTGELRRKVSHSQTFKRISVNNAFLRRYINRQDSLEGAFYDSNSYPVDRWPSDAILPPGFVAVGDSVEDVGGETYPSLIRSNKFSGDEKLKLVLLNDRESAVYLLNYEISANQWKAFVKDEVNRLTLVPNTRASSWWDFDTGDFGDDSSQTDERASEFEKLLEYLYEDKFLEFSGGHRWYYFAKKYALEYYLAWAHFNHKRIVDGFEFSVDKFDGVKPGIEGYLRHVILSGGVPAGHISKFAAEKYLAWIGGGAKLLARVDYEKYKQKANSLTDRGTSGVAYQEEIFNRLGDKLEVRDQYIYGMNRNYRELTSDAYVWGARNFDPLSLSWGDEDDVTRESGRILSVKINDGDHFVKAGFSFRFILKVQ